MSIRLMRAIFCHLSSSLCLSLASLFSLLIISCDSTSDNQGATFDLIIEASPSQQGNAPFKVKFNARNNGPLDGEYEWNWDFTDGQTSTDAEPEHIFEAEGEYIVKLDAKENKSKATASGQITITVLPATDLKVSNVSFTPLTTSSPGKEITVSWLFENLSASSDRPFQFSVIASLDNQLSDDDLLLTTINHSGTTSQAFDQIFNIPDQITEGNWKIAVVADLEEVIGDLDRSNNVAFALTDLKIRRASSNGGDLSICGIDIPSFVSVEAGQTPQLQQGDQLNLQICIANLGNRPVINSAFAIYLSEDETLDANDLLLSRSAASAIDIMDRTYQNVVVDLPVEVSVGLKRIIVVADPDDEELEIDEDNNIRISSSPFQIVEANAVTGVDLIVTALSFNTQKIYWGQNLSGNITIKNRGDMPVSRLFVVRFMAIPVTGGEELQLPSLNLNGIEANGTIEQALSLTVNRRIPAGRYRIKAVVDPTNSSNDVNPGNNQRSNTDILELGGDPNFDPAVQGFNLSNTEVNAGMDLDVTVKLKNLGNDPTQSFELGIYLGVDQIFDALDRRVKLETIENLMPQELKEITISVPIPQDLDQQVAQWYVMAYVDPNQRLVNAEISTDNNRLFAESPLRVMGATGGCAEDQFEDNDRPANATSLAEPLNDLGICDEADWFSLNVPAGQYATVSLNFDPNLGRPKLSLQSITETEIEVGELRQEMENSMQQQLQILVPSKDQVQNLLFKVDGAGAKLQYGITAQTTAISQDTDLYVHGMDLRPGIAESNSLVELSFKLNNLGNTASLAQQAQLKLVTQPSNMDGIDLGMVDLPALGEKSSISLTHRLTLGDNLRDGLYYVLLVLDQDQSTVASHLWAVAPLRIDALRACNSDIFEPNGSPYEIDGINQNATSIMSGNYQGLYACSGDDDWYRISVGANQALSATIQFNSADGDLDLALYQADGTTLVERSTGLQGQELVDILRNVMPQEYLLRVYLNPTENSSTSVSYRLNLVVDASASCQDDVNEPNADFNTALPLADGRQDLILCPGDEDWFAFNLPAGNNISIQLAAGVGNVNLTLFDPDQQLVAQSDRRIVHNALINGLYLLKVSGTNPNAETPSPYTLAISGVSGVDLSLDALSLSSDQGGFNDQVLARALIVNQRADQANQILVRFSLSSDQRPSVDDIVLGEQRINSIAGASQLEIRQRLVIPMQAIVGGQWILAEIDPLRALPDLRPANNLAFQAFTVLNACIDDDQRTNESILTPTVVDFADGTLNGVICPYTEDYFSFTASAGVLSFSLVSQDGDLDLMIYDEGFQEIGRSAQAGTAEALRLNIDQEKQLFIRVDGFLDARGSYALTWNLQ